MVLKSSTGDSRLPRQTDLLAVRYKHSRVMKAQDAKEVSFLRGEKDLSDVRSAVAAKVRILTLTVAVLTTLGIAVLLYLR